MNRLIRAFTSVTIAFIMTMVSVIPFNMTVLADEPEVSIPEQTPVTYSAFILNRMISNADGTMTLERADIRDKGAYDSDVFAAGNKIRLLKEHIDPELKAGDMALAWQNEDGWHAVRAGYEEIILTDDPEYTSAESADPGDLVLSNRYSNFIDTMRYFGFTQGEDAAEVTVWLLPEDEASDEVKEAIGFTSASSGKELLKKAKELHHRVCDKDEMEKFVEQFAISTNA